MTVKTAKIMLTLVWGLAAGMLLLILILRQLSGFYGANPTFVWSWAAQYLFPALTLIGAGWSVGHSPNESKPVANVVVLWIALAMSIFYLAVLFLQLGFRPSDGKSWHLLFEESGLYLGLILTVVIGFLGKFFIDAKG